MAPISWYATLESLFKDAIGDGKSIASKSYRKKNVLVMSESRLYAWLDARHAVLSVDLSRLTKEEIDAGDERRTNGEAMKLLLPSSPPSYDVTELVLEPAFGQRLAMVGSRGVNVLVIPNASRTRDKDQERTLCSSMEIGERLLLNHPQCEVLGVKWHPGSNTHSHLLLLLSNNTLRVLDVKNNACVAVSIHQLGPHPVFRLSSTASGSTSGALSSFGAALGETVVDFDLGSPVMRRGEGSGAPPTLVWPLYLLRGNGDVYTLYINQPHERNFRSSVKGPLSMHPPAEDNYGVDACSILCVPLQPPLLVIATSYGMIYHCVVLANDDAQDQTDRSAPTDSLFVYENIELDDVREGQPMDQGQPIRIFKDGSTVSRYHCCHWNGVHTVALPLVPHLQSLSHSRTADEMADLVSSIEEQNCVVEHVVCTRPLSTSKSNPVIGLGVICGIALGGTTLICLLGDYELLIIPLAATYLESLPRLLLNEQADKIGDGGQWSSELETSQVNKEPFDQQIRRILQRRNTNPIYKSNANNTTEPLLKDCLHLLNKSTRILREEYIQRLDLTHETIQERVKVLQDLKAQQLIEIEQLSANQIPSTDKAQHLAEKYEELKERQEVIVKRVENVLGGLLKNAPMLSEAERSMKRELLSIEEKSKHLKNSMKQIRAKESQRNLTIDRQRSNNLTKRSTQINPLELQQIKEFLIQETNSLTSMTEQLKQIQLMLNL